MAYKKPLVKGYSAIRQIQMSGSTLKILSSLEINLLLPSQPAYEADE